jgi:hypothetical protein
MFIALLHLNHKFLTGTTKSAVFQFEVETGVKLESTG